PRTASASTIAAARPTPAEPARPAGETNPDAAGAVLLSPRSPTTGRGYIGARSPAGDIGLLPPRRDPPAPGIYPPVGSAGPAPPKARSPRRSTRPLPPPTSSPRRRPKGGATACAPPPRADRSSNQSGRARSAD